jgi:D-alanyl-D-alanine carboxypeptidase
VNDLFKQSALRTTDQFRIGSLTKTFVGVITLQLAEEGKLSLDDKLSKWYPGIVPAADSVTIRMLLNHTSGIPNYLKAPSFQQALIANIGRQWTAPQLVQIAAGMPRTTMGVWDYSNTNYILLGMIIEKATASTFKAQLQTRIIDRLGLRNTSYVTDASVPTGFTSGYCDWGSTTNYQITGLNASIALTAGAMISTLEDVTRWEKALASGELLSPAMFQQQLVTVPTYSWAPDTRYGLGIVVSDGWVGHKGDIFGFNAVMYSKKDVGTIVVITNKSPNSQEAAPNIFRAFSGRLYGAYPVVNRIPREATSPSLALASRAAVPVAAAADSTLNMCTTSTGI